MAEESLVSAVAFAESQGTSARQVRRWVAAGLPVTADKRVRVDAAVAWLAVQAAGRGRSGREIAGVLVDRADELQRQLEQLVATHVPSTVVDAWWDLQVGQLAAALRAWPAAVAPRLAARLRGEDTPAPADPRLTPASVALLVRAPASPIALALATAEEARAYLEQLAVTPHAPDPAIRRAVASARAREVAGLAGDHPRSRLMRVRARLESVKRAVRRGDWERLTAVEQRSSLAVTAVRQLLLEAAPRAMIQLSRSTGPADAAAVIAALSAAVEIALYELRHGVRPRCATEH